MLRFDVSASATVPAPATLVYRILADYRQHHPHILPKDYFRSLEVEAGGVGADTQLRVEMHLLGTARELRLTVAEPERGRVLTESAADGASVTTFTVEPDAGGSRVTIKTLAGAAPGLRGVIERIVTPALLRRVYREQLRLLASYAAGVAREAARTT